MMTSEEPKVNPNGRYTPTETSRLLGVHRNTLRNYLLKGWIKCGLRRYSGRKFYSGAEILKLWRGVRTEDGKNKRICADYARQGNARMPGTPGGGGRCASCGPAGPAAHGMA